ncbi:MAG: hypothetical protein ACD_40C00035G0001, partial [uncultured bacterium]
IDGARGILFNITGGSSLTMTEVSEAAEMISSHADPDANIIFGATIDEAMGDQIKISVIATGFDNTRGGFANLQGIGQSASIQDDNQGDNSTDDPTSPPKPPKEDSSDPFDIPAFLRQQ